MRIHGIVRRRLGTDGNGVTDLVAMAGCPLKCKWCMNKRTLSDTPTKEMSVEDFLTDVMQEACYFVATDGGVAFGGGEPLLQWQEIVEFADIKPDWVRLTVETALQAPPEAIDALMPVTDFWLVDIKTLDPSVYADYTSGALDVALSNLRRLLPVAAKVRVRVPAIPGYKSRKEAESEAERIRSMGFADVEVFDYVIREQRDER